MPTLRESNLPTQLTTPLSSLALLEWHKSRRCQGLPTISILVGPDALGYCEWRAWSQQSHRTVIAKPTVELAVLAWLVGLRDLLSLSVAWVRSHLNAGVAEAFDPSRMTRYDLDERWREIPIPKADPVCALAYAVLDATVRQQSFDAVAIVGKLGPVVVAAGLCGLVPDANWPTILLVADPGSDRDVAFDMAVRDAEKLATRVPRLPIGVCVAASTCETAMTQPTRTMALAREGEIRLTGLPAQALSDRLNQARVPTPHPTVAIHRLVEIGLVERVADAFVQACAEQPAVTVTDTDVHRSESERFLFELLESMPDTAGLFVPNQGLDFLHGTKAAEADLLAAELKLVIEIDGSYYHLNREQYRRDRRKDYAYQQHGYWVLRFLAEDVVVDLESILMTIREAVMLRQQTTLQRGVRH